LLKLISPPYKLSLSLEMSLFCWFVDISLCMSQRELFYHITLPDLILFSLFDFSENNLSHQYTHEKQKQTYILSKLSANVVYDWVNNNLKKKQVNFWNYTLSFTFPKNFNHYQFQFLFYKFFYCCAGWGYIVAFAKVLTVYQIHPLPSSFIFSLPITGIVSTGIIFQITCMYTQYVHCIHSPTSFLHHFDISLIILSLCDSQTLKLFNILKFSCPLISWYQLWNCHNY
jgi:hypothetical protein